MTVLGLEMLTVGRVGVDMYPEQPGPLATVTSFAKSLGGTATNVAVGCARLGRSSAVLTKVGRDAFGDYVVSALSGFGVSADFVGVADDLQTPVVFCELDPPDDPSLLFYRAPIAPDLTVRGADVPWDAVRHVPVLWLTGTGVSAEPSRRTHLEMLVHRGRPDSASSRWTCVDLDWRPSFWRSPGRARAEYQRLIEHATVVVGNRAEVEVAVGTDDPRRAAERLVERGIEIAVVKMGADGVLVATPDAWTVVPPHDVAVVCGLGAGDAFGAAFVHGLLSGWEPARCAVYANPAGALVASRLACADAMPTSAEVESLLGSRGAFS